MKLVVFLLLFVSTLAPGRSQGIVVRSPSGTWNSYSQGPFLIDFTTSSMRYQQVWGASGFISRIPQGGWITQLALNLDGQSGPFFGTTLQDVEIKLSTTSKGPDELSSTFQQNIGADETIVFGRGPLTLSAPSAPFDQVIVFDTPFMYDPSQGNLLFDVWNYQGYTPDPHSRPGHSANDSMNDSVSRVVATSVDSLTGNLSTRGLVAQFTVIPIPEPSPWMFAGLAIALGVLNQWRRNFRKGS